MKCKHCSHINSDDSVFCEECGKELGEKEGVVVKKSSISKEIDDVIFVPKKKRKDDSGNVLVWVGGILMVLFIGWLVTSSNNRSGDFPDVPALDTPIPTIEDTNFPIYNLSLNNLSSEWTGYNNQNFYVKGTLKNAISRGAQNIRVRVDFTSDKAGTDLLDTRYITLAGVAPSGAYTFNELVPGINLPSNKQFWFTLKIESADSQ